MSSASISVFRMTFAAGAASAAPSKASSATRCGCVSWTSRWSVYGGIVVMDTEVTASKEAKYIGRDVANIPTTQFSLLTKYNLTDRLTVGAQAIYNSETLHGLFAVSDQAYELPSYWRFDVLAEYKLTDNFGVQLNVVNLTDELYYDAFYRSASPFVFVAPGRAAYLTLNWKY